MRYRLPALVACALLTLASAGGDGLADLVRATATNPTVRAAMAATEATRLRAAAVSAPVTLSVAYEQRRLFTDGPTDPLPPPFDELFAVDEVSDSLTVTAAFRPFLVGDLRDLADSRLADLERSELAQREARAAVEAQAVNLAVAVLVGEHARVLAETSLELARRGADATSVRLGQGAASEIEARRAALRVEDAERGLANATRQAALAADALGRLVGSARLSAVPELPPVLGVPPDLVRASLDLALAELGLRSLGRGFLPTVQAGYTWLLADDGGSLTLALESRTAQPSLTYARGGGSTSPGSAFAGLAPSGALPTVRGAFTIGVTWTISLQASLEQDAAAASFGAAAAALEAAHDRARAQRLSLDAALQAADETVALARLELDLAREEAAAAEARLGAGLIGPLERDASALAATRAELDLWRAQADHLRAVLDYYTAFAIPLSEVLP
jgi:outer membrane protein TolC